METETHNNVVPSFKCNECPASFEEESCLELHMKRKEHSEEVFTCETCSLPVMGYSGLLNHFNDKMEPYLTGKVNID